MRSDGTGPPMMTRSSVISPSFVATPASPGKGACRVGVLRAALGTMHALGARGQNGRYVIDESADLPEGAEVEVLEQLGGLACDIDSSILAKAFRGELVPQDPNDEPASVLLERIRAEQEGASPKKKPRRRSR